MNDFRETYMKTVKVMLSIVIISIVIILLFNSRIYLITNETTRDILFKTRDEINIAGTVIDRECENYYSGGAWHTRNNTYILIGDKIYKIDSLNVYNEYELNDSVNLIWLKLEYKYIGIEQEAFLVLDKDYNPINTILK